MKIKKVDGRADFTDWQLDAFEKMADLAKEAAAEALACLLADATVHLHFPAEWAEYGSDGLGGEPVKDPLTLRITFPCQEDYDARTGPFVEFNLREILIEDVISGSGDDGKVSEDPESMTTLVNFRDAFQSMVNTLNEAITTLKVPK